MSHPLSVLSPDLVASSCSGRSCSLVAGNAFLLAEASNNLPMCTLDNVLYARAIVSGQAASPSFFLLLLCMLNMWGDIMLGSSGTSSIKIFLKKYY